MRSKECDKAENAARDSFDREDFTNGTFRPRKERGGAPTLSQPNLDRGIDH